jgi:hypothetical protein
VNVLTLFIISQRVGGQPWQRATVSGDRRKQICCDKTAGAVW